MSSKEPQQFELVKTIGKTFKMLTMTLRDEMKAKGLNITRQQGMLLRRLNIQSGIIQNELAWITERDKTSLARLITKMEKNGLVYRKVDEKDKRAKRVFITEKGRILTEKINKILSDLFLKFQRGLKENEIDITMNTLQTIQNNLDNDFEI
ncbi:MAG: MarR family transcriptional regulator [Saprospiraceae bacterium]|nr:MarR family transcriptional regulator [Saprospiraceae bacterium]